MSIFVNSYGTSKFDDGLIAEKISEIFDLRPAKIIEKFQLKKPIYEPRANYGVWNEAGFLKAHRLTA